MKKISVITINYNSLEDTLELLQSIENSTAFGKLDPEVIVVDNASREDPGEAMSYYPWAKLIRSQQNLGFAGGNNLGIKSSTGDYIFIVNNDARMDLWHLLELVHQYQLHPSLGLLCPVIKNPDGSIQFAGYTEVNPFTLRNEVVQEVCGVEGIVETSYPHGAAMLISRENLEKVGLMKENYFLYYEELDWGHHIRRCGFKVGVCLSSEITHKSSATTGKISELKLYFQTRNRILFARNNFPWFNRVVFSLFFSLFSAPKHVLTLLIKRDLESIRAYGEAIIWHFRNDKTSDTLGYKFDTLLQ